MARETSTTSDRLPSSRHLFALDGLRTVAVFVVILNHYAVSHFYGGLLGVDLFFVLSGFLITRLLTQEFDASNGIRFDLFYLRRVCRLVPATIGLLTFVTILRFAFPDVLAAPLSWWFSDLAVLFSFANFYSGSLNSLGHCWSLSVEEQFYLLWPLTLLIVLRFVRGVGPRIAVAAGIALFAAVLRFWLNHHPALNIDIHMFIFTRMDSLLAGAILALAEGLPGFASKWASICRYRPAEIAMVIFLAAVVLLKPTRVWLMNDGGNTVIAVIFAILIASTVYDPRPTLLKRFLESQPLVWLGRRSYGIYLYMLPIFYLLLPLHTKFSGAVAQAGYLFLGFALPVLAAALSYHFIEMPFLRLKKHLKWNAPKTEQEPATVSAEIPHAGTAEAGTH